MNKLYWPLISMAMIGYFFGYLHGMISNNRRYLKKLKVLEAEYQAMGKKVTDLQLSQLRHVQELKAVLRTVSKP